MVSVLPTSSATGACRATAPSNIALIKYWGKSDASLNWPANDSLSMTLSRAHTVTTAQKSQGMAVQGMAVQGMAAHRIAFGTSSDTAIPARDNGKAQQYLEWLRTEVRTFGPAEGALDILTNNSFPSSCGIASSASGFAALTLAAVGAWTGAKNMDQLKALGISTAHLSAWARRGSGSACRSIDGGFVRWTRGNSPEQQSAGTIFCDDHWQLADVIVMIDRSAKKVSSTEGHARTWTSPLMKLRMSGLSERMKHVLEAIESRDLERLGTLIETEATEMHAVMMTAIQRTDYFGTPTIDFISWLRHGRAAGNIEAWFTLDAGANPHLLCHPQHVAHLRKQIIKNFPDYKILEDQTGGGAKLESLEEKSDGH